MSNTELLLKEIEGIPPAYMDEILDSWRRVHTPAPWGGTKGMYPESNTI
jgi:hypothetical protein